MRNPNGYGGIVYLGKNRRRPYACRITTGFNSNGSQVCKYIGYFAEREEALAALADYNRSPFDVDALTVTFSQVYELAKPKMFRNASPQKIMSYQTAYKHCQKIHNKKIRALKTPDLQQVLDECPARSKSSLNNILVVLHAVFNYAMQCDYIQKDYSQYVEIYDTKNKKEKTIFTDEEIAKLWQHKDNFHCRLALVLIYTGFRINELLRIKTANVNMMEGYMTGGLKTQNGKNRIVPIHNRIYPLVAEFFADGEETLITIEGKAVKYNIYSKKWQQAMGDMGINHTFHECRHTTASLLARYGAKDFVVKKILGHSANDLTKDVYTHVNLAELKAEINKIP